MPSPHIIRKVILPGSQQAFRNLYSFDFDGIDEYMSVPHHASISFDRLDPFTYSVWVNMDSIAGTTFFFEKLDATRNIGQDLWTQSSGQIRLWHGNNGANTIFVRTEAVLTIGTTYNIIWAYNGNGLASGVTIYLNGISQPITVIANTLTLTTLNALPLFMGSSNSPSNFINSRMDEKSIWNKAFNQAEATELYNEGIPADLLRHSAASNLVMWLSDVSSFSGGVWTLTDMSVNSNDASSVNMEQMDRVAGL